MVCYVNEKQKSAKVFCTVAENFSALAIRFFFNLHVFNHLLFGLDYVAYLPHKPLGIT